MIRNFQNHIAKVALSLDTNAYSAGDVLADTQVLALPVPASGLGRRGRVLQLTVLDKDDVGGLIDLVFLRGNVSLGTENSAPSISDTDAEQILRIVPVTSYTDLGGNQIAAPDFAPVEFVVDGQALYIGAIARSDQTHTADGIVVTAIIQLDDVEL